MKLKIIAAALWYSRNPLGWLLIPLAWIYCAVIRLRKLSYQCGWLSIKHLPVPVIILGNLTVGGTGKTPLILTLANFLRDYNLRPGILTRGYGGKAKTWPQVVLSNSDPYAVGDEAVLLARNANCPVIAGPDRVAAGKLALNITNCNILLSDDGLQHYRLAREISIILIDGERKFGNCRCLPAGPLREPISWLKHATFVWSHGGLNSDLQLISEQIINLADPEKKYLLNELHGQKIFALAGIGNPKRFFTQLTAAGLKIITKVYPDHHWYTQADLASWPKDCLIIMTEKDAVKCARFKHPAHWYLPVTAVLNENCLNQFIARVNQLF